MGYKSAADGVASKGKTSAKVYPNDGAKVIQNGPGGKGARSVKNSSMKMGRNLARAANQRGR